MKNEIVKWREREGVTQSELASRLGVEQAAVSKWEAGQVSHLKVLALHRLTGIPLHLLRPDLYPAPDSLQCGKEGAA